MLVNNISECRIKVPLTSGLKLAFLSLSLLLFFFSGFDLT